MSRTVDGGASAPRPRRGVRRARVLGGVGVALAGAAAYALALFQPWKLWVDDVVDDAAPIGAVVVAAADAPVAPVTTVAPAQPVAPAATVAPVAPTPPQSSFVSRDHATSGRLVVLVGADGAVVVRFEGLDTSNGPDLKVYLSTNPPDGPEVAFDDEIVDLGRLRGNIGDQNYVVPAGVDLGRYASVVIWCDRFDSAFGAAPLT